MADLSDSDNELDEPELNTKTEEFGINNKNGVFAATLSRILSQSVEDDQPILAKRKKEIMKEIMIDKEEEKRLKKLKREKKEELEKQMVVPDFSTESYERQLKKLANRGVVALFNAIAKAKRGEGYIEDTQNSTRKKKISNDENLKFIKQQTKNNFHSLELPVGSNNHNLLKKTQTDLQQKSKAIFSEEFFENKNLGIKDWDKDSSSEDED